MDVVLEVFDTFAFDPIYATLFPLNSAHQAWSNVDALTFHSNATWSGMRATGTPTYQYEPASQYFSLRPSESAYLTWLPRDSAIRQVVSLYLITWLFGLVIYFVIATLSYFTVFDHETFKHPKFLKNQVKLEIRQTMSAMPTMAVLTIPFFLAEVRGYSKMYDSLPQDSWWALGGWYNCVQFPLFIVFTDFCIYWIHRGLHHPLVYKHLHKPHHKWVMPSPFASHAFHPLDGYAQSVPYHVFPFIFPLNKFAYIILFTFINVWTVLIHDGDFYANNKIVNGAACHSIHHTKFDFNYGQYTTLWDRLGQTYARPGTEMFVRKKRGKTA